MRIENSIQTVGCLLITVGGLFVGVLAATALTAQVSDVPTAATELSNDPLLGKKTLTLDDLMKGLADAKRRDLLIPLHYHRAAEQLTEEERQRFLRAALRNKSSTVQRYAALELDRIGQLSDAIRELLDEMTQSDDATLAESARLAKDTSEDSAFDPQQVDRLLEDLASTNPSERISAEEQLLRWGPNAVPFLLDRLDDDRETIRIGAALQLRRLATPLRGLPDDSVSAIRERKTPQAMPVLGKARHAVRPDTINVRKVDPNTIETVRVYFGTNRAVIHSPSAPKWKLIVLPTLVLVLTAGGILVGWRMRKQGRRLPGCTVVVAVLAYVGFVVWAFYSWNAAYQTATAIHQGPSFGPRRSVAGTVYYGHCEVSLPPTHSVGKVERPLIGKEDEEKHVVLRETAVLGRDAFFDLLKKEIAKNEVDRRDCFVFVHGYNVSFAEAARRTAQIHHDLKFEGLPIFYSWPSRNSLRHYPSDRNEVSYSKTHIKKFLLAIANETSAGRVHVIAHSMGGAAVCEAIAEIDDQRQIFDQIILAAPDIDADVFMEQIVPELHAKSRRTTLYCSRADLALHASYAFNDAPRAGDSSRVLIVSEEFDTVDASDIDADLLGHSYYGDGLTLLNDVRLLLLENLSPARRNLERRVSAEQLDYWMFP